MCIMTGACVTVFAYEIYVRGISHSLASSQATNESLRELFDHNHSLWPGKDFNLIEMSLMEFHGLLLQRLQCPDILPAWLGGPHCANVPASSCLQAQPPAARRSVPCITGLSPSAPGLPCYCRRPRHRGTHYLSRHTEFRSDVWGHGQVGREEGRLLRGWQSTASMPLQLGPCLASPLRSRLSGHAGPARHKATRES